MFQQTRQVANGEQTFAQDGVGVDRVVGGGLEFLHAALEALLFGAELPELLVDNPSTMGVDMGKDLHVYRYVKTGTNHYSLAFAYERIAASRDYIIDIRCVGWIDPDEDDDDKAPWNRSRELPRPRRW